MSGLACATCFKFFRVKKMGVAFEEGMPVSAAAFSDAAQKEDWRPYKLWMADLCECPGCGAKILITGPGQRPVAEHYQAGYQETRQRLAPLGRVDDCGGKKP
jgi:hypothetical protein